MERGEVAGNLRLTEQERNIAVEALRADGFTEAAEALESIGRKEIPFSAGELIIGSVKKLAEGGRADAQGVFNTYQEIALDFPNS